LLGELRALIVGLVRAAPDRRRTVLTDVTVANVDRPTPPVAGMTEPTVVIVAQGVKRTLLNGTPYDYRAGQYLVITLDLPVIGQALHASPEEPFVAFTMRLRPTEIAALLLETSTTAGPSRLSGLTISDAGPDLLDPVVRLLRIADRPDDLRVLGAAYRREILWRLLTGEQGDLVRQVGLANGNLAHVSRAIRWIRDHYREPVLVADLAALSGMSASSFHRHFRSATSMTPIQFQKQIRLQTARTLLLSEPDQVAEIAYRVGYESPSQFNRDYRKTFGTTPGRDPDRLVNAAPDVSPAA